MRPWNENRSDPTEMEMRSAFKVLAIVAMVFTGCATVPSDPTPEKRQEMINSFVKCAQLSPATPNSALCAYELSQWAYNGWGTSDGKKDRKQFYFWLKEAVKHKHTFAAVVLGRAYTLGFVTGKYEPDEAIAVLTPAYDRFKAGWIDKNWTKETTAVAMSEGLGYRGSSYHLKGNDIEARKDFCRALSLDPKNVDAARWLIGIYGREDRCSEYLQ